MAVRSHVDPCTFVMFIHVTGDQLDKGLVEKLREFEPKQGVSASFILDHLPVRSHQVLFHEAYHFWQGLRLPFVFRYALLSFRQAFLAFKALAAQEKDYSKWDCGLPEFERLGLDERIAIGGPGKIFWCRDLTSLPAEATDEIRVSPLDLLECAASIAEFQVTVTADTTVDPVVLSRWEKRNPAYLEPYAFASRFLANPSLALRAILPLINATFHTSEPVRTFVELLGRVWGMFVPNKSFANSFLAQREPCRWNELFEGWLGELPYKAKPDFDGNILGSPYHRINLENWVGAAFKNDSGGFVTHPFLGLLARKWIETQGSQPEYGLLMDHPAWVRTETFWQCRNDFSPPLTVYRFHLGGGDDRVLFAGLASGQGFTSLEIKSESEWRGFVADALTVYGAVRRASGAHFDAEQRTCHHVGCPHYEGNFCNSYPVVPKEFLKCGFPQRIQRMANILGGYHGNAHD